MMNLAHADHKVLIIAARLPSLQAGVVRGEFAWRQGVSQTIADTLGKFRMGPWEMGHKTIEKLGA